MMRAGERTILAVEDDRVQSLLYQQILGASDTRVVVAESLAAADQVLATQRVDLVLLDLFLPDGDGRSWLARLRARGDTADLPVIVIAGATLVQVQAECYELGAATVLTKPVPARLLSGAVQGTLRRGAPPIPSPVDVASPIAPASRDAGKGAVLLAEDDEVVAALVTHRLGREGFVVERARDGIAALEIAGRKPLSVAVLDIMMPGMNGFELLTRLRGAERTARLPIVMLTGLGGERDVERALALGANDYVLKPFSPVELSARVHRLLRAG